MAIINTLFNLDKTVNKVCRAKKFRGSEGDYREEVSVTDGAELWEGTRYGVRGTRQEVRCAGTRNKVCCMVKSSRLEETSRR
jgi:hypothetical protein